MYMIVPKLHLFVCLFLGPPLLLGRPRRPLPPVEAPLELVEPEVVVGLLLPAPRSLLLEDDSKCQ